MASSSLVIFSPISLRHVKGLALGTLNPDTRGKFLYRELRMAVALSSRISIAGFVRAVAFQTPLPETVAVTLALGVIVLSSVCLGAVLPLGLQRIGVDPAHSSTTIQVVMDILGGERREFSVFYSIFRVCPRKHPPAAEWCAYPVSERDAPTFCHLTCIVCDFTSPDSSSRQSFSPSS